MLPDIRPLLPASSTRLMLLTPEIAQLSIFTQTQRINTKKYLEDNESNKVSISGRANTHSHVRGLEQHNADYDFYLHRVPVPL